MEGGGGSPGPAVPLRADRGQRGAQNRLTTEGERRTKTVHNLKDDVTRRMKHRSVCHKTCVCVSSPVVAQSGARCVRVRKRRRRKRKAPH